MAVLREKRKVMRLFWRVRAEIRRQMKDILHHHHEQRHYLRRRCSCSCRRLSFHYDPFSYALNFDNGSSGFFC
ncbi:hypothetical protein SAY87_006957 [Trapa incisa]|uniref:Uncharacterized protein n=1 Tax=Trapa incisa TaxID=236973 RepID=A0AAN7Q4T9_9MYRT|nr:hypothetical protein SAY87_006957 [Trapa incisa]